MGNDRVRVPDDMTRCFDAVKSETLLNAWHKRCHSHAASDPKLTIGRNLVMLVERWSSF